MKANILFLMSGSIACYKACTLISRLVQAGASVQTVATPSALKFIGTATLEGLTGRPVLSDTFAEGHMMDHIFLNRWADGVILCPASANTINKMASGVGDDFITTIFLAYDFKKPFWVAPTMNTTMLQHPVTQKSLAWLQDQGIRVLKTESGVLACGDHGEGKLLDPEHIFKLVVSQLDNQTSTKLPVRQLRVLITSGGTREPIDSVRYIGNISTGRTGAELADYFAQRGHHVCFIHAQNSLVPIFATETRGFRTFNDLHTSLTQILREQDFDLVIHAAAVSDFSLEQIRQNGNALSAGDDGKISSQSNVELMLKPNQKIVSLLKKYSRSDFKLVAFKLTSHASAEVRQAAVARLFEDRQVDFVVHNDLSEITTSKHFATLYRRGKPIHTTTTHQELAAGIEAAVMEEVL